jgi:hypothetical protein
VYFHWHCAQQCCTAHTKKSRVRDLIAPVVRLGHGLAQLFDDEYVACVVGAEYVVTRFQLMAVAGRLETRR